ncbi:hypothetical protein B0H10DRAFT_1778551, partial [Mycena sp. CBHHK59/15]
MACPNSRPPSGTAHNCGKWVLRQHAKRDRLCQTKTDDLTDDSRNVFPPEPASNQLLHKVATGYCGELKPAAFEEAGCAVCGCLTIRTELTSLKDSLCSLDLLEKEDVTRKEWTSESDPIEELTGPVLDSGCDKICVECETSSKKKKMPLFALANGFWIGHIPPQLQNLTFAEGMLIAKVRHNRALVRVSSGQAKMISNIIMFSNPMLKMY